LAYQGGGRGLDLEWLIKLNDFATFGVVPDITFFIDVDAETGHQRRKNLSSDRIESAGSEFQNEIRNKYFEIIDKFSERCVNIDGNLSMDLISKMIWEETKKRTSFEEN
jgi:dTMP kinase